jgi:kynureninase
MSFRAAPAPDLLALVQEAEALDRSDPAPSRNAFVFPAAKAPGTSETEVAYFAGNSLGLRPKSAAAAVEEVLSSWSTRAVAGHFSGKHPWSHLADSLAEPMSRIVGAHTGEIVVMNTLTVNLHLMMAAFYRPTGTRTKIVIEAGAFPSDDYAVTSQARLHGLDPADTIVRVAPRAGESLLRTEDILLTLDSLGDTVAVAVLPGINFRTGQLFDIPGLTAAVRGHGAVAVWDLAHAAGNVPLRLHDWNVDAAVWCTYKYLNSGPGAIGGAFIHDRHVNRTDLVRLTGWWGNNPDTRFAMSQDIDLAASAPGWQISNPPILAMAPIRASLEIFDAAGGMDALRERSLRLTAYLESLIGRLAVTHPVSILTPRNPAERGAQLSVLIDNAAQVTEQLIREFDVVPDERPPNIVRFAPAPLYSSYRDCWRAAVALSAVVPGS